MYMIKKEKKKEKEKIRIPYFFFLSNKNILTRDNEQ